MYMGKELGKIGGARFYHPPSNNFGASGHVKWHPESLYDPNLSKYDIPARIQGVGRLEDYQFLVDTALRYDNSLRWEISGRTRNDWLKRYERECNRMGINTQPPPVRSGSCASG